MKRFLAWMLTLCLLCACGAAFADDDPPLAPDLYLHGNPTTGYDWTYVVDQPKVLAVTDNGYTVDNGALAGSGGVYSFRLDGLREGYATVTFSYGRGGEAPVCVLSYTVDVDDDGDVSIYGFEYKAE